VHLAGHQVHGKPVKITKVRGQLVKLEDGIPTFALLSPYHVIRRPAETQEVFESDCRTIGVIRDNKWKPGIINEMKEGVVYEWCHDIGHLLKNPPKALACDVESTGGRWYDRDFRLLTVQLTYKEKHALVIPTDREYFSMSQRKCERNLEQIRQLLANKYVAVCGHNFNSDRHALRRFDIDVANFYHETIRLVFLADENMLNKGLDDSVRRFVPRMAGYADSFNIKYKKDEKTGQEGKDRMDLVPHDEMLQYAGGDTDADFDLCKTLVKRCKQDRRNWKTYGLIQMPALRTFFEMEEIGIRMNTKELDKLAVTLAKEKAKTYQELMAEVPRVIKLRHKDKGLSFSRDEFVRDILYSKEGFNLTPKVFTKGTAKLAKEDRVPSVSTKQALPFYDDVPWTVKFTEYKKLVTMESKYVGKRAHFVPARREGAPPKAVPASGFWKYLSYRKRIHPSFFLHRTNTGRTASAYPNAQNWPKRGELAKAFRATIVPTKGFQFIEADLSQAELRIAAWMANEPTMLRIYNDVDGDIHAATAATIMGISGEKFAIGRNAKVPLREVAKDWPGAESYLQKFKYVKEKNKETGEVTKRAPYVSDFCDYKRFQAKASMV